MDMADVSAMTEASGLENDPAGIETSRAGRGAPMSGGTPFEPQWAARLSDELRRITAAAPLRSLFTAFLLGVLVARRRRG